MNRPFWRESIRRGFPMFLALSATALVVFIVWKFDDVKKMIDMLIGIFSPIIIGGVLAYILKTPVNFFEKIFKKALWKNSDKTAPVLSVAVVLIMTVLLVVMFLVLIIPELINSVMVIAAALPGSVNSIRSFAKSLGQSDFMYADLINQGLEYAENAVLGWVNTDLLPMLYGLAGNIAISAGTIFTGMLNVLIGFFIALYLLFGRKKFAMGTKKLLYAILKKDRADAILHEIKFIDKTFVGYIGGKLLEAAVMGLITYVFCVIMKLTLGFKNEVLIAIIIGVTNIIPYFGAYIGVLISAILIFIDSPVNCLIFIVFFVILQQIDGNVIGPKLMSGSVGLDGFWVLFAIVVFGGFFGIGGMVLGIPVFAVFYEFFRRWVRKRLKARGFDPSDLSVTNAAYKGEEGSDSSSDETRKDNG